MSQENAYPTGPAVHPRGLRGRERVSPGYRAFAATRRRLRVVATALLPSPLLPVGYQFGC
jgi:hypothetical protein